MPDPTATEPNTTQTLSDEALTAAIHDVLLRRLPVSSANSDTSVGYVSSAAQLCDDPGVSIEGDRLLATLRVFCWDVSGDSRSLCNVKEQRVALADGVSTHLPERILACVEGWTAALEVIARWLPPNAGDPMMPHDLYDARVLNLRKAERASDFASAFLQRGRLGRLTRASG